VNYTLKDLVPAFEAKKKLPKTTEMALNFFVHMLYDKNPVAANWFRQHAAKHELDWVILWIESHHTQVRIPDWNVGPVEDVGAETVKML